MVGEKENRAAIELPKLPEVMRMLNEHIEEMFTIRSQDTAQKRIGEAKNAAQAMRELAPDYIVVRQLMAEGQHLLEREDLRSFARVYGGLGHINEDVGNAAITAAQKEVGKYIERDDIQIVRGLQPTGKHTGRGWRE